MMQTLAKVYNDPHKQPKTGAIYRNLRMGDQGDFETFMSKFTTYPAQANITDDTIMREDLFEKVTKVLHDNALTNLPKHLYAEHLTTLPCRYEPHAP